MLRTRRYPLRDGVIILLSVRAGLRAKEISNIRWSMVTDAQGAVTDTIHLVNGASKGKRGGREIPMAKDLRQALVELQAFKPAASEDRIIFSGRDIGISPKVGFVKGQLRDGSRTLYAPPSLTAL
jgi:integrase/recombinase XerD